MLGKTFKKASKWLGKAHNTLERGNNWLGKAITTVKSEYRDVKKDLLKKSGVLRPLLREAITDLETSPLGNFIEGVVKQAELRQEQLGDILSTTKAVVNTGNKLSSFISTKKQTPSTITDVSRFMTS